MADEKKKPKTRNTSCQTLRYRDPAVILCDVYTQTDPHEEYPDLSYDEYSSDDVVADISKSILVYKTPFRGKTSDFPALPGSHEVKLSESEIKLLENSPWKTHFRDSTSVVGEPAIKPRPSTSGRRSSASARGARGTSSARGSSSVGKVPSTSGKAASPSGSVASSSGTFAASLGKCPSTVDLGASVSQKGLSTSETGASSTEIGATASVSGETSGKKRSRKRRRKAKLAAAEVKAVVPSPPKETIEIPVDTLSSSFIDLQDDNEFPALH